VDRVDDLLAGVDVGPLPEYGYAIATRATRGALALQFLRAVGSTGVFLAIALLAPREFNRLIVYSFIFAGLGGVAILNCLPVWWRLRSDPWVIWNCRFAQVQSGRSKLPTLVLTSEQGECVLAVWGWRGRAAGIAGCDGGQVWLAGDPRSAAIVAAPGGTPLLWARPISDPRKRESRRLAVLGLEAEAPPPLSAR
jgi:hypothetical protein